MSAASAPPILSGLSDIAGRYDGLISDVWGVVHNGREGYAAGIDAIRRFRASRGPVVLLSNAPRPPVGVETQFDRIGVPRDFYDAVVTSGGAARADLEQRTQGGRTLKVFYLGPNRDTPLLEGLNVALTDIDDADVVLCTGPFKDETEKPEDYRDMLEHFKRRGLTFLCANPDIVVMRGDVLVYCAGALARFYEELGGKAVYYGKPHPPVFEAALAELAARRPGIQRVLVIGDGLETDVAGANRMGLDVLFVAGGIHMHDSPDELAQLFRKLGVRAAGAMTELRW
jgi:HAD superfamily hydrolase (TIGR01459 family)